MNDLQYILIKRVYQFRHPGMWMLPPPKYLILNGAGKRNLDKLTPGPATPLPAGKNLTPHPARSRWTWGPSIGCSLYRTLAEQAQVIL